MNPSNIGWLEGIYPPNRRIKPIEETPKEKIKELTRCKIVKLMEWGQKNGVNLTESYTD